MDKKDVKYFLGKNVNVSIVQKGREFLLYGELQYVGETSARITNSSFGDTMVLLENITKISERKVKDGY
jgi:hypothetical protein